MTSAIPSTTGTAQAPALPLVSYLVAAKDAARTLPRALDSLLAQVRADWEAIVVDDGSSDETLAIANWYAASDSRFRVLAQPNAGPAAARNLAASVAVGRYLAILDADDELTPQHLAALAALADECADASIISSDGLFMNASGEATVVFGYAERVSVALDELLRRSLILGGGTLISADAFRALGGFRSEVYCEDYDLWLRGLAYGLRHVATNERLYIYHVGIAGQKSTNKVASMKGAEKAILDLLASQQLSPEQRAIAREAADAYRKDADMEAQAAYLATCVVKVFGPDAAPRVLQLIRRVSGLTRPLRRWAAGR